MTIKKIALLTGGGDCPGLNAAIRAMTRTAIHDFGWEVMGIHDGFEGAVLGRARHLTSDDVANILPLGGTILGTSNTANPFEFTHQGEKPSDQSGRLVENLQRWGVDALFCTGGDGTLSIAHRLCSIWPQIIGLPKTIDNDLRATDQTFGFDTACNFVTEAIDRIHSTAQAHHRVMVVEVMGRYAGWIALCGGLAGGGDIILIPEMPFSREKVTEVVRDRSRRGKKASIVVASEGAHPAGEGQVVRAIVKDSPDPVRLGGIGQQMADYIESTTGHSSRVTVLGHMQRGGAPSFYDRVLATRCGTAAVKLAAEGGFGRFIVLRGNDITSAPLAEAASGIRLVTPDHPLVAAAMSVGTSFGV
jgi:phosphofructokinase-like protein